MIMTADTPQSLITEKHKNLSRLLDAETYVLVHFDPKNKDVIIPTHLSNDPSVTLKLSRYFRGNLEINEDRVAADLLFSGTYFTCVIPYEAIWGCTSEGGENIIWPESTPEEVLRNILESALQNPEKSETETTAGDEKVASKGKSEKEGRSGLSSVPKPARDRSHLKRIK